METNLQSSEVRIPKTPQSTGSVCPQFKSTFARSLSFNTNTPPNKPLDFEISFRIAQNVDHSQTNLSTTAATVPQSHKVVDEIDEDFEEFMRNSPLKQSLQNLSGKSTTPTTPPTRKNAIASRVFNTTCSGRHRYQDTQGNKSCSPEIELLRLRKECQNLLEENRRLVNRNGSTEIIHGQDTLLPTTNNSVEEAVLQTQIETLQWQLTQVESSRQMYHALMEEVVRFLERCYQSIESMQKNNKIARSRSINHMFIEQSAQSTAATAAKTERRISDIGSLRSNLNIASDKTGTSASTTEKDQLNESFASSITTATTNSTDSYNNFTDFTWRRSPKKSPQKGLNDDDAEKLSQEAFRLYRTAQNLLNLKEPILSESKSMQSFHRNSLSDLKTTGSYAGPTTLQRKLKSRESHNSYQSNSTSDGSVHSNSSSIRTETDEEIHLDGRSNGLPVLNGNTIRRTSASIPDKYSPAAEMEAMTLGKDRIKSVASSSADDESGFSSMNSFHHEPNPTSMLPPLALNSTMLSNQISLEDDAGGKPNHHHHNHHDVLKPEPLNGNTFNLIQSEMKSLPPVLHRRFDSAPPIPPKKKLTTFTSLKNENSPDKATGIHVLWV
ncbi:uncharacterized protein LOC129578936 [Sitodiplosis mosellana]|uniref:uncharacterized protein LOC129578936 n=1 Tax=Sitodiplosis mosellana TaxID=263140 RepID=UPI002443D29E|nr:uncharacterized protein LOC129578936 [Sitodiplosis mosellana]XP_055324266.1 uncharacterized protein LOC129578936 [Sitodiplosis mosellana]XP_055324268.1 uncharacterized protein LOC129578936 [Sitodiplosis mosellana]XP_055324269.1 uncharacterized protein LOC129578936 [Sitodiplosis mosellana]XP_055324270.1 uncharacterized protein LOC129578936 [Sitodiplosis mosellana]